MIPSFLLLQLQARTRARSTSHSKPHTVCVVPRVIDDRFCPPDGPHDIKDYPIFYDPIYYPNENPECFETPLNFCVWLNNALKDHASHCFQCDTTSSGSVAYDGLDIYFLCYSTCISLVKSTQYFSRAEYTHCQFLNKIVQHHLPIPPVSVPDHLLTFPKWFSYSDDVNERNLDSLSIKVIHETASSLPDVFLRKDATKKPVSPQPSDDVGNDGFEIVDMETEE
ncbi:hypothetical protein J3R83DRAFT_9664 [Lanmaoa asiatica]|nr:hypothetical protein J3R83DRAFT_9664 [Lanmaoa asiatica]